MSTGTLQEAQADRLHAEGPKGVDEWHKFYNGTDDVISNNGEGRGERLDSHGVVRRILATAEITTGGRDSGDGSGGATADGGASPDVGDCILLFGAFCNGEKRRAPLVVSCQHRCICCIAAVDRPFTVKSNLPKRFGGGEIDQLRAAS